MKPSAWNEWLAAEDSASVLAPQGYDDRAALLRVEALRPKIVAALDEYEIRAASPELYQDSTATVSVERAIRDRLHLL